MVELWQEFLQCKFGICVAGKHEDPCCTVLGNQSPNMNFASMFAMTLELWLFPFVSETELAMPLYINGAFVCEDDVVKCLSVFIALQNELYLFRIR